MRNAGYLKFVPPNFDHFDPFELILPWPPSINHYWAAVGGKFVLRREGRAYRKRVAELLTQQPKPRDIGHYVNVAIGAYPPDERTRDLDNLPKAIFDALTHCGVWRDDSLVERYSVTRLSEWNTSGFVVVSVELAHKTEIRRDDDLARMVQKLIPQVKTRAT